MASRAGRRAPVARVSAIACAVAIAIAASAMRVVDASTSDARVIQSALSHRKLGPDYSISSVRQAHDEAFWSANVARDVGGGAVLPSVDAPAESGALGDVGDASVRGAEADADEPVFRDASGDASGGFVGTFETCDTCALCALGDVPAGVALTAPEKSSESSSSEPTHCALCYGCNVILNRIEKRVVFNGKSRPVQLGASSTAVFKGKVLRDEADGGGVKDVFVKAWCGLKGQYRHLPHLERWTPETCPDEGKTYQDIVKSKSCPDSGMTPNRYCNQHFLNAIDKIAVEAGLGDITPRTWTLLAKTFTPWDEGQMSSSGVKQELLVQVFDKAPGVSLESLGAGVDDEKIDLINSGDLNRIKDITLFDFLTSQRDRHGQNIFFDEFGNATVIDNETAMISSAKAGLNSMFIPGGQKYETYRVGYDKMTCAMNDNCDTVQDKLPTMGILLDYRCYVEGGYIGKDYSPTLTAYLEKLEGLSAQEIQDYYQLPRLQMAEELKERAHDMLHLGFEGAVKKLYASMRPGDTAGTFGTFAYAIVPPCCGPRQCTMSTAREITSCVGEPNCAQTYIKDAQAWIGPNTRASLGTFLESIGVRASDERDAVTQVDAEVAAIPNITNTTDPLAPPSPVNDTMNDTAFTTTATTDQPIVQPSPDAANNIAVLKEQIERMRAALERVRDIEKKVGA